MSFYRFFKFSSIIICFINFGCDDQSKKSHNDNKVFLYGQSSLVPEKDINQLPPFLADWKNPAILPLGASLGNTLRAYYLVGQFDKMLDFLIVPDCLTKDESISLLMKFNWGYEIKLTNVKWNPDSTFVITYKTNLNNTVGIEEYYGMILNDTAKIFFYPEKDNLLKFTGDFFDRTNYFQSQTNEIESI